MEAKTEKSNQRVPLIIAGIFLGVGLCGFFDGIVLHQILQWHHMLSNVRPLTTMYNIDMNTDTSSLEILGIIRA
jgi:uncharacterized membrane protein